MKRHLSPLILIALASTAHAKDHPQSHPVRLKPQTTVVFLDHEVPSFLIVEQNGQKRVVIDGLNKKTQLEPKKL